MFVTCLTLSLVLLNQLKKMCSGTSQARYLENENTGPTYETISDVQCECNGEMDILKADLSLISDKCEMNDTTPVHVYEKITPEVRM